VEDAVARIPSNLVKVIDAHRTELDRPGVLSVRPGYEFTAGWLTGRRAIVVTVRRKLRQLPADQMLPDQIAGVPVDVRQASARKCLELLQPNRYAAQLRLAPDTGSVPHFPQEQTLTGDHPAAAASAHAELAKIVKTPLTYAGPAHVALKPITAEATLILSASPDAGWPVLRDFLTATTTTLTVGMYDFTAGHIATVVQTALAGKRLNLVIDHPPQNATADQADADTVADLRQALSTEFGQAWALTKLDKDATAWIYPTSYHIKVAVRDRQTVWLSSGNWNNSNQPDITPATNPTDAATAQHRDRDWHVVVTSPKLAGVFEDYLLNDLTIAQAHNTPPEAPGSPLTPPTLPSAKTPPFTQFFPAATVTGRIKLAPLLTPDPGVYADAVKALITSATKTLYMQFQYIELPKTTDSASQPFVDLVHAVIDRHTAGVDVRIIMSEYETAGYLEQLQATGLDVATVARIQNGVHNKGIIVDSKTVLVSSQNWSVDGALYNRDAGIIIYNKTAATYYQQIFLHDWQHLAKPKALPD
jgi:PLD-like domain